MPQKFFTNTIENKFIKNMLLNTPLPLMDTVSAGDFVIEGCFYIFDGYVIKCTRSGVIFSDYPPLYCSEDVYVSDNLVVGTGRVYARFTRLMPYVFGKHYDKITERFVSKHSYYDSETHLFLGKYLRCIRDIYGIDLMPFYNCFNYKIIKDIYLSTQDGYVSEPNDDYKIVSVPIKFNKTYSICIDCSSPVLLAPVLYGDIGPITDASGSSMSSEIGMGVTQVNQMSFTHPMTYRVDTESKHMMDMERYLCLIIQLPSDNDSSIFVVESDISGMKCPKVLSAEGLDTLTDNEKNALMISELSLARFNDQTTYAFSDRLIEYLLLNAITGEDEFSEDIIRVQQWPGLQGDRSRVLGIWDDMTRYTLFTKYMALQNVDHLDINGFVDKDIENFLLKTGGN